MSIDREQGHYWVLFMGRWTVGFYYGTWSLIASDELFDDEDFSEIGKRIPNEYR